MKKIIFIFLIVKISLFSVHLIGQSKFNKIQISNLNINSEDSDFGLVQVQDSIYFFASKRKDSLNKKNETEEKEYLDFYEVLANNILELNDENKLYKKTSLNTPYNDGTIAISPDGEKLFFTRSDFLNKEEKTDTNKEVTLKIYSAEKTTKGWTNIKVLPFSSDYYSVGHPTVSKDGKTLYFISDMPGSVGATDVFSVSILGEDKYSIPVNLGEKINTTGKEMFPYIDEDGTLYFASDSHSGNLGGLDIYYSKFIENEFQDPKNIGRPINSEKDDFAFIKITGKKEGFFSSDRYGGKGSDDIYYYKGETKASKCISTVKFTVIDAKTNEKISDPLIQLFDNSDKHLDRKSKMLFTLEQKCNKDFYITVSKDSYSSIKFSFTAKKGVQNFTIKLEKDIKTQILAEKRVKKDSKGRLYIDIGNIYFASNSSKLNKEAQQSLDILVSIMEKYPSIKVEIGSHTDSRGRDKYNQYLSDKRASSTKKYVLDKGVTEDRIFGKGYGESELVNRCANNVRCSKKEHAKNRRTEFIILDLGVPLSSSKTEEKKKKNYSFYSIQIGSFKKHPKITALKDLKKVYYSEKETIRYYVGKFMDKSEAKKQLSKIKKKGFSDAFITKLKKEEVILLKR